MNLKKKSPFTNVLLVGKNHTLWPQTVLELLATLREKFKTNIHLISVNAFKKLFILPLSLKILWNLCLLSSKQETAANNYCYLTTLHNLFKVDCVCYSRTNCYL